jgi:hypothetical protein
MLWAIISSVVVIYIYRQQDAENAVPSAGSSADTLESELAALSAQVAALESRIAVTNDGGIKP